MSRGHIIIGPGTMYGALKKLIADRWIAVQTVDGQKIYTTTKLGREAVRHEYERLSLLIEMYGGDESDQG
jgi:DNA-binding PadR family transcriptional regulator